MVHIICAVLTCAVIANSAASFQLGHAKRRPFEGELAAFTLWPEIEKVFGHGYEVCPSTAQATSVPKSVKQSITLAVSTSRGLAATACKATSPEHAVVRVYDTTKWQPVGEPLVGHQLTVTSIAFSPDDRHVLTVSRDRSWRLFERKDDGGECTSRVSDEIKSNVLQASSRLPRTSRMLGSSGIAHGRMKAMFSLPRREIKPYASSQNRTEYF